MLWSNLISTFLLLLCRFACMLQVKTVNPGLADCFLNKLGSCHQEASAPLLLSRKIVLMLSEWIVEQMFKSNVCIRKKDKQQLPN